MNKREIYCQEKLLHFVVQVRDLVNSDILAAKMNAGCGTGRAGGPVYFVLLLTSQM